MTYIERVLIAVHDEQWQAFRVSMKGKSTETKIDMLKDYYEPNAEHVNGPLLDCPVCLRIDNYIKALCRGGQLYPDQGLTTALSTNWQLRIRR
jgi:hypothetical protein